jgi:N-acetylmuramoyl-L-alanine amidase
VKIAQFNPKTVRVVVETKVGKNNYNVFALSSGKTPGRVVMDFGNLTDSDDAQIDMSKTGSHPSQPKTEPTKPSTKPEPEPAEKQEPAGGEDMDGELAGITGLKGSIIVIDPGHGGSDSGAIGPTGVMEKSVTLRVSNEVKRLLVKEGATVYMTRNADIEVSKKRAKATDIEELQARCDVANRDSRTALFLSIHCNAFSSPSANGMETYYSAGSRNGQRFATLLNQELAKAGGLFNRGVKTANYYVLRHTNMPASLVELAFVTNYREEKLLRSEAYQNKLAAAIVRGIARYFQ